MANNDTAAAPEDDNSREAQERALIERAKLVAPDDLPAVRRLIAEAVKGGFEPNFISHLASVLARSSGISRSTIAQIETDARNTWKGAVLGSPVEAAAAVLEWLQDLMKGDIVISEGAVWYYGVDEDAPGTSGCYVSLPLDQAADRMMKTFGQLQVLSTPAACRRVLDIVRADVLDQNFFLDAPAGLNLVNGFLRYDEATRVAVLDPPDRDRRVRHRVEAVWQRDALASTFLTGLELVLPDPSRRQAVQEFLGCALLNVTPGRDNARHVMLLHGPQNAGKSTILKTLELLIPEEFRTAIAPTQWEREFDRAKLAGKLFNLVAELGEDGKITGRWFKAIAGFDRVSAREPFGRTFEFSPTAWHVFATNTLPRTDDASTGFERRIVGIRFDRSLTVEEMQPDFFERVSGELAGIVAWAAAGAERAMQRGYFALPDGHARMIAQMQFRDDFLVRFVFDCLEPDTTGRRLPAATINRTLLAYARADGLDPRDWRPDTHAKRIAGIIRNAFGAENSKASNMYWTGIRIKPDALAEETL